MPDDTEKTTVYYDGSCPLCAREIGLYRRSDGAGEIAWCDISRSEAAPPDLSPEAAMKRFHVRGPDGRLEDGARAFVLLWLSLPRWRWLGRIASVRPIPSILEGLYRAFLPLRPTLQRLAKRADAAQRPQ